MKFSMTHFKFRVSRQSRGAVGFSLVELMIVMSLLTLIVLALMQVFSSTQRAFRASVTQADVLEGGRAVSALIADDLRKMAPCGGYSNFVNGPVNFFVLDNSYAAPLVYSPLKQDLPGGGVQRTNYLNYFFILSRENTSWVGIGYVVDPNDANDLYPLYRYYAETNVYFDPVVLLRNFNDTIANERWTNMSHVIDGVVHLVVRPLNLQGFAVTNTYQFVGGDVVTNHNIAFYPQFNSTYGCSFYSNTVPASVELEVARLEDRAMQRAESLPTAAARAAYLAGQSGSLHIFRQLIPIPNVDRAAYQ
jgi:type II secretory pathway pseudopilin PulG